jgi:hypothetical protein
MVKGQPFDFGFRIDDLGLNTKGGVRNDDLGMMNYD